jgi:hypothetical protein
VNIRPQPRKTGNLAFILVCWMCAVDAVEQTPEPPRTMSEHVTCGVLFRILVGGMQHQDRTSSADLQVITNWYKERAFEEIAAAKRAAVAEFGDEAFGIEMFDDEWQAIYADMMNQMGRNYRNLSRLRYRYGDSCDIKPTFN